MSDAVLTKQTSDLVVGILADMIKPHVPAWVRPFIKMVLNLGVGVVNKLGGKYIPDEIDPYINEAIIRIHNEEWDNAAASIGMAGDALIDIPNIDDAHERNVFVSLAQALVQAIRVMIEKKKAS